MPAPFIPLRNYAGTQHVLGAPSLFVHPANGNMYVAVIEQISGTHQDLVVYRLPGGAGAWTEVKRYRGTIDSVAQFAFGSVAIGPGGNMVVVTSLIIPNVPRVTVTGFQGAWLREMGIDIPYPMLTVPPDITALIQRITELEAILSQQTFSNELAALLSRVENVEGVINGIHEATE